MTLTLLRTRDTDTLLFEVETCSSATALERELAARLACAEDRIADLQADIEVNASLLEACFARELWSAEDLAAAVPPCERPPNVEKTR